MAPSWGFAAKAFRGTQTFSWTMRLCIAASVVLIAIGLWRWGAVEVRGHFEEVFFLTFLGVVWLIASLHLFPWLGLCIADDAIERRNPAALVALSGATLAVAITYVAGNFGEGPSYWNNIFSAGLGTIGLFAIWFMFELGGRVSVSITEERDFASGVRLCGYLLATGLILGRAVAGDWHSGSVTVHDFFYDGWPAAVLCVVAVIIERFARPTRERPCPGWVRYGFLPALIYVGVAITWICHLGPWEGKPA